jgi:adenylate cyclase
MPWPDPKIERHLAAIFAADVEGYSRLMGVDEVGTLRTLTSHREVMDRLISEHGGRIANTAGDSVLAEFPSVVDAVQAAVEVQKALANANEAVPEDRQVRFRIGVHVGDVMVKGGDLFGDGVNIAARLQAIAEPGGVCVSGDAYRHVRKTLAVQFTDLGAQQVRNVADPVSAFRVDASLLGPVSKGPEPLSKPLPLPDKPSIAVLPFANIGGDPEQDYFADGITEELTTALARLRGFFVIARNSAFTYKGKPVHVQQVGRDLGVRYVLEGSVRRAGERVRVGVQLADTSTGREVWSERFDRSLVDVFALQDEIAANVVVAVEPKLYAAERHRIQQKQPGDLDAWDQVIRAMPHMWRHTRADYERALSILSEALRLDPLYARALGLHAWLSLWLVQHGWVHGDLQTVLQGATERARASVEIDGDDAWGRLALGFAHMYRREHAQAVEEMTAALDLNPNFALGHACLALALAYGGKGPEAVARVDLALRLSPRDPFIPIVSATRSFASYIAGDYAAGLEWGRRAVRQSADMPGIWRALALNAAMSGLTDEARSAVSAAVRLQPDWSVAWVHRASPLVHASDRQRYCEVLVQVGLPE